MIRPSNDMNHQQHMNETPFPFVNIGLAFFSSIGGWIASWFTPEHMPIISVTVTVILFFIGKCIDIAYKEWKDRQNKKDEQ